MVSCCRAPLLGAPSPQNTKLSELMDIPTLEKTVLTTWSSIYNTKQSSIFIFKCKNKKIIYGYVDTCVLFFF